MVDWTKGIPRGRPSRVMPKPFQRPSIAIQAPDRVPKVWRWVNPDEIAVGDMVRDHGVVVSVESFFGSESDESSRLLSWNFRIVCGLPESHEFQVSAYKQVWAFAAPAKKDTHG